MIIEIFFTLLLIFLNAFFVAAEFAIVKVRISQIELKVEKGSFASGLALNILKKPDAYLSATQVGVTLASLGLGWIGKSMVAGVVLGLMDGMGVSMTASLAQNIALPVTFILLVILHIVLGELVPKSVAIQRPEAVSLLLAYPMSFFYVIFKPFIWVVNGLSRLILRLLGLHLQDSSEVHTAEELQLILDQSKEYGTIQPSEHELMKNVFSFNQLTAKQVMVPRTSVTAIDVDMSFEEIVELILEEEYSRMPVYRDNIDNIIGVAFTKDLLKMLRYPENFSLKDAMRPAYFVPNTKKINELLKDMQEKHVHLAVVTDEFGGVAGIVTIEDIIEELVGEIQDEYDEEPPAVEMIKENEFVVNALSSIEDVNEFLPVPLPKSSSYDTIAGLTNNLFDKIPDLFERKRFDHYELMVLKKSKQSVLVVKLIYHEEKIEEEE